MRIRMATYTYAHVISYYADGSLSVYAYINTMRIRIQKIIRIRIVLLYEYV